MIILYLLIVKKNLQKLKDNSTKIRKSIRLDLYKINLQKKFKLYFF